jgi:hypothetical protein
MAMDAVEDEYQSLILPKKGKGAATQISPKADESNRTVGGGFLTPSQAKELKICHEWYAQYIAKSNETSTPEKEEISTSVTPAEIKM